jgi:hypothetical protein
MQINWTDKAISEFLHTDITTGQFIREVCTICMNEIEKD